MKQRPWRSIASTVALSATLLAFLGMLLIGHPFLSLASSSPTATPAAFFEHDGLATPVLPARPTQIDLGHNAYYYHCMPCHGDVGQGLTDEWRHVWVEDHQNCWGRRCHGGKVGDEGFPLPRTIPAVFHTPDQLQTRFPSVEALYDYLQRTHPPQRPGALAEDEYWSLTALLLAENERLPAGKVLGPQDSNWRPIFVLAIVAGGLAIMAAILAVRQRQQHIG